MITLLTDFGTDDIYVGVMKGVIAGIAPNESVVDLTHGIPPFDVLQAALKLKNAAGYFPPETIHVAVVDPGVGGDRKALGMRAGGQIFLAPDNGLLWPIARECGCQGLVEIASPRCILPEPSSTFHGRDIFAPAAAHLATGMALEELGPPLAQVARLELPALDRGKGSIAGEVLWVDRFGNLVTNIPAREVNGRALTIAVGGKCVEPERLSRTYTDVESGKLLAMSGAFGALEIAVRDGSAAAVLKAGRGTRVEITLAKD